MTILMVNCFEETCTGTRVKDIAQCGRTEKLLKAMLTWVKSYFQNPELWINPETFIYVLIKTNWNKWEVSASNHFSWAVVVFNIPQTAKVIWRRGHSLKSHPSDWWSWESNLRSLVYRASGLSTTPQRLLFHGLFHQHENKMIIFG